MEIIQIDPAQIEQLTQLVNDAVNSLVMALGCVCFWLGLNSWEGSGK